MKPVSATALTSDQHDQTSASDGSGPGEGGAFSRHQKADLVRSFYDAADAVFEARDRFGPQSSQADDAEERLRELMDARRTDTPEQLQSALDTARAYMIDATKCADPE